MLTDELACLLNKRKYTILSHNPESTQIISEESTLDVKNDFYKPLNLTSQAIKVTGLGDKYITLVSLYHSYLGLNLVEAIKKSQEFISNKFLS